jgi:hypothetical protein
MDLHPYDTKRHDTTRHDSCHARMHGLIHDSWLRAMRRLFDPLLSVL